MSARLLELIEGAYFRLVVVMVVLLIIFVVLGERIIHNNQKIKEQQDQIKEMRIEIDSLKNAPYLNK